ncbi:MAG: tRNA lysidine(34) synthetase TilS [Actinomycetota bacterium]
MTASPDLLDHLVERCTFPPAGATVTVALSGGADSSALLALCIHADLEPTAIHVHHGLRSSADDDAATAARIAARFGVPLRVERAQIDDGPNLEARARAVRRALIGPMAMTGHTADDQAETVLLALLRGAGARGLAAMRPGPGHPILDLRRAETRAVCDLLRLEPAEDPTNDERRFRRNRLRHEAIPMLGTISERDIVPLLVRAADLLREDDELLERLSADLDPSDATAIRSAPAPMARRALRRWLDDGGYAPDAAAIERVMAVARGEHVACEISGGRRVARSAGRLHVS